MDEIPSFDQRSFKLGIYVGVQAYSLISQLKFIKRKLLGKLPFLIQVLWTLSSVAFTLYERKIGDTDVFLYVSNCFDFSTKVLVIYFICIRITVLSKVTNNRIKYSGYVLFWIGVVLSFFGLFYYAIFTGESAEVQKQATLISDCFYLFLDFYISLVELVSLSVYLVILYDLKSIAEIWPTITKVRLRLISLYIVLTALLSVGYIILNAFNYDSDWNWSSILSTLKYTWCCDFVFKVFKKTMSNTRPPPSSIPTPGIPA